MAKEMKMKTRTIYYVNSEHTGRRPICYTNLDAEERACRDYERITLKQAREMAVQRFDTRPGGAGDYWANCAGRAVLKEAGIL